MRAPARTYRTWMIDSSRWQAYVPRPGDVVVATYPKSGTTWMQRIISLLMFDSLDPVALDAIFPWLDMRTAPLGDVIARLDGQRHRRSIKSHLPADGLPIHSEVKYIHVARDGREAALSYHNHCTGFTQAQLERMDAIGLSDPLIQRPYPRLPADPASYFRLWLTQGSTADQPDGVPALSWFAFERSWLELRAQPNVLLVHYCDLLADLAGEMARVAAFLDLPLSAARISELSSGAGFARMRAEGSALIPGYASTFAHGAEGFFKQGRAGTWRGIFAPSDLELFDRKLTNNFSAADARWLLGGGSTQA